ncbi:plasmalemma vesicle-associated protein [Hyla sarda]|uniref:plasmalemma vesicle-associated protein n=1 Tax=Hyla sarda TaxID=327740 RepID=UPI0024C2629A|nr:plasmalemma vesicle-associated protein [Hyla sarda]
MDPNYAMAKFGLESKNILKTKHRGCWYYTKYFFFFLSIIQFLIILGLVLFMLYGNAHVNTELRLMSVENRYKNLTLDYTWLNGNYSLLKSKLSSVEKENQNCTKILDSAIKQLGNRTAKPPIMLPPPLEICKPYQFALDRLNTTYIIDILQLKHALLLHQSNHDRYKESCDQNILALTTKGNQTVSEIAKLRREKEDLEAHINNLQTVCNDINKRFDAELDVMKRNFDSLVGSGDHHRYSNCWPISNEIKRNIDQAINRLKQDVNNVMYENSQMKTENGRVNNDFQKCNQEKKDIISEKTNLSIEKLGLEKQLSEKKEEIAKSFSKYMKKEEELENCRKMQTGGRMSGGAFPRI